MKQTIIKMKEDLICLALATGVMASMTGLSLILIRIFTF